MSSRCYTDDRRRSRRLFLLYQENENTSKVGYVWYGGFLLPDKYILFERSKKYTSDFLEKSEKYFFRKKYTTKFLEKSEKYFFHEKIYLRFSWEFGGIIFGPFK